MKRFLAVALAAAPCLFAAPAHAMTVDEIVARNIQAHGGVERLHAIQSIRIDEQGAVRRRRLHRRDELRHASRRGPGTRRIEGTWQGMTSVDAYDGHDGWRTEPVRGPARPVPRLGRRGQGDGARRGHRRPARRLARRRATASSTSGTEDIDGTLAHKLRVTRKDGDFEYDWLDPGRVARDPRSRRHAFIRGAEQVSVTDLGDYEQVAGVWMAFAIGLGRARGEPPQRALRRSSASR